MDCFESLSVVIPAHHALRFIDRSVHSVLRNTPGAEIIIVENGSKDLVKRDWHLSANSNISYCHLEVGNKSIARNLGAQMSKGELITFLDQDDEILPGIIKSIEILREETVDAVIATQIFAEEGAEIPPYLAKVRESGALMYHPMTLVTRPRTFFELGGFDPGLKLAEDFDLIARFKQNHKVVLFEREPTLLRHFHDKNDSLNVAGAREELFAVLRKWASSDQVEKRT